MFKKVLVPVDGSGHANRAVDCAADLANKYGAELIILHVIASPGPARIPPELYEYARIEHIDAIEAEMMKRVAEEILQAAENRAREQGAKQVVTSIGVGHAAEAIVAANAKAEEAINRQYASHSTKSALNGESSIPPGSKVSLGMYGWIDAVRRSHPRGRCGSIWSLAQLQSIEEAGKDDLTDKKHAHGHGNVCC